MNLKDLISNLFSNDQLVLVQGVEKELRSRNRKKNIFYLVLIAFLPILLWALDKEAFKLVYFENFWRFSTTLFRNPIQAISSFKPVPSTFLICLYFLFLLVYSFVVLARFRHVESEEPFRYTFWIKHFEAVEGTPDKRYELDAADRFKLIHHDLMEKLNSRINRLSLLDLDSLQLNDKNSDDKNPYEPIREIQSKLIAHIQISGSFAIREENDRKWVIHVMPQVRIGPVVSPSILANPVKFPLEKDKVLSADQYNQFIERVYSSVATEVYKQIELDVLEKVKLFPTARLRAVALFHEAEDFANSNTIDAYDRAIKLYREALRYFDIAHIDWVTKYLIRLPFLWRLRVKLVNLQAQIQAGYIKCLVYRKVISALTGRNTNPIFGIRPILEKMLNRLRILHDHVTRGRSMPTFLFFPKDSWLRNKLRMIIPTEPLYQKQCSVLFDGYLTAALGYSNLDAKSKAQEYLESAKNVNRQLSERNALYLLTKGLIEENLNSSILTIRRATEIAPNFQFAQFMLAQRSDWLFRMKNDITDGRLVSVIGEYEKVLDINPGNLAALSAQGHLFWLLGNLNAAKKKFEEGTELKTVVSDTFIGEISYGLARIAAEEGRFNDSFDLFHQAISADPGIATYYGTSDSPLNTYYYDYMVPQIIQRYEKFKKRVEQFKEQKLRFITRKEEEKYRFNDEDIKDPLALAVKIKEAGKVDGVDERKKNSTAITESININAVIETKENILIYIKQLFTEKPGLLEKIDNYGKLCDNLKDTEVNFRKRLLDDLNRTLESKNFYSHARLSNITFSDETIRLINRNPQDGELLRLNRLLIEETFPDELLKHEVLSKRVINSVFSYVLNDYGNACLGYFARLGLKSKLEEAIQNFTDAINVNKENVIVLFNRHVGNLWKGERMSRADIDSLLREYRNQRALVSMLGKLVFDDPQEIVDKKDKLQQKRSELDKLAQRKKNLQKTNKSNTQIELLSSTQSPGKLRDNKESPNQANTTLTQTQSQPQNDVAVQQSEKSVQQIDQSEKVKKAELTRLEDELNLLEKDWNEIRKYITNIVVKNSNFSFLLNSENDLGELTEEMSSKLKKVLSGKKTTAERLTENDYHALKSLLNYYAISNDKKEDFKIIQDLCDDTLDFFYPEDFDIDTILESIYHKVYDDEEKRNT